MYTQQLKLFGLVMLILQDGYCTSALSTLHSCNNIQMNLWDRRLCEKGFVLTYEGNYNTYTFNAITGSWCLRVTSYVRLDIAVYITLLLPIKTIDIK